MFNILLQNNGSDFFKSEQGGDPVYLQHLYWLMGQPTVWLTLFVWLLILVAIMKLSIILLRAKQILILFLFLCLITALISGYTWLFQQSVDLYTSGAGHLAQYMKTANWAVLALGFASGCWIIFDWVRRD